MGESWASSPGRRRNMQAIRSRDTAPEMAVRRLLYAAGLRYRVHYKPIPTLNRRADIVFTRQRIAVFIDGCFWHGCPDHGMRSFQENSVYWKEKMRKNVDRDRDTEKRLLQAGWRVIRFWEHEHPDFASQRIILEVIGLPRSGGLETLSDGLADERIEQ